MTGRHREPSRSLIGDLLNRTPISYAPTRGVQFPIPARNGAEAQMRAIGSVGTLFAIVNRLTTAVSQVDWHLYRSAPSGKPEDRVEVTRHLALDIWNRPNPFYTRQRFVEAFQQHQELTGEAWWVVVRNPVMRSIPLELWPVRPDRMAPKPHPTDFISGYTYTAPSGEVIDLALDEVITMMLPNPLDPYRGLGPVQSLLTDLDSTRYSAEWNRNFFINSAEPGGVIEVDKRLDDTEFDEMQARWNESHRGVSNAHRVAIIEQGKWVNNAFSMRDMQFAELRSVSREVIREGFGFPKPLLGAVDDVNRANADAAEVVFARWLNVPRLVRMRSALNSQFLPMFGPTGSGLEFDFDNPVPEDQEGERAERESKANAAKIFIADIGFEPDDVLDMLELPKMRMAPKPEPPPVVVPPTAAEPAAEPASNQHRHHHHRPVRGAARINPDDYDLSQVQADWETALAQLMADWTDITAAQRDQIADQVRAAINNRDPHALAAITVDSATGAALLADATQAHAELAAERVVDEAADQGVATMPGIPDSLTLTALAAVVASLLAAGLAAAAGREALHRYSSTADGQQVADAVDAYITDLSPATLEAQLGGALTSAQNAGRMATFAAAPEGALYASEVMDKNTCDPCREVNGRWLGNISQLDQVDKAYPNGGYVDCEGGIRCRGTIVGVWRPKQVSGGNGG